MHILPIVRACMHINIRDYLRVSKLFFTNYVVGSACNVISCSKDPWVLSYQEIWETLQVFPYSPLLKTTGKGNPAHRQPPASLFVGHFLVPADDHAEMAHARAVPETVVFSIPLS